MAYMKSLSLAKPHLILVVGITGAGKSFFAEQFADTFQAPLVSEDHIRLAFEPLGKLDDKDERTVINKVASDQISELIKTKNTIIVDACCDTRTERTELSRKARLKGYEPLLVWVQTAPNIAKLRATKPNRLQPHRRLITAEQHDAAVRRFTTPNAAEKTIVISGKHTYASQAKLVLTKLAQPRAEISGHAQPPVRKPSNGRIIIR
jgi:predicted kinase